VPRVGLDVPAPAADAGGQPGARQDPARRPFGYGVQVGTKERTDPETGATVTVPVYDTNQPVPREAQYERDAADRLLAGQSQAGVVAWLREEGVTTTEGAPMNARALRHILLAPRVAGLIEHDGQLYEAVWPGNLSRETWEDIRAYYRRSAAENPYQGRERRYLLSGVAECYACHGTVRTKPSGGRNRPTARIYHCWQKGCQKVHRSVGHLDAYVEGRTVRLLQDPRFTEQLLRDADRPDMAAEIATLERRRADTQAQLDALADHPDVDVTAALTGLSSFTRRLQELRSQMAATSQQRLLVRMAGISREAWEAEPVDIRSATVAALWRVEILPATHRGPGFSPSSVRLTRRLPGADAGSGDQDVEA
jgi:site-specific DNA recombinase